MSRLAAALFLIAIGGAFHAATAPGSPAADVTLKVERFWSEACNCHKYRFSGTIPSGAANEYVAILQQRCGQAGATAIAGASTRAGGFFEVESNGPVSTGTFRARWENRFSDPVTFRADMPIRITPLGGGRVRVELSPYTPLKKRRPTVELQRLTAGQWTRVRVVRLAAVPGSRGMRFSATLTVRRKGLVLRVFVPAASAGPCYAPTASETWTSGAPAPPGSTRVVDRTVLCSIALQAGIRELSISASALDPYSVVPQSSFGAGTHWVPDANLVSASANSVALNPNRCSPSRSPVALTPGNLQGGVIARTRRSFECETPSRVLLRIRAVFGAPAAFQDERTYGYRQLVARGDVREATLAIRTQSGKRVAFASLSESGRVRFFVARSCVED